MSIGSLQAFMHRLISQATVKIRVLDFQRESQYIEKDNFESGILSTKIRNF